MAKVIVVKDNNWIWVLLTFVFVLVSVLLGVLYYKAVTMNKEQSRIYKEELKKLNAIKDEALKQAASYEKEAATLQLRADSLTTSLQDQKLKLIKERKQHETNATAILLLDADSTYRLFTERTGSDR
jgi:F0F1-type ATP synthase membrane subunit b/b'